MTDTLDGLTAALAGRYRIQRELGSGGMATVYLAEDERHRRKVAVKVLRPEIAAALGAERFLQEIAVAAQLNHPHILALYDSGQANGFLYYVMPVVEGESLRQLLDRQHQLPIDDSINLTQQIASALDYAHRQGVLHRDIKPENVLLHEGEAMVTDFGIALAISEAGGTRLTETGFSLGTPHYMSPEQAAGERDLDARSDVYALGCVLFEMLAGEPPFTGNTAQSVIAKRITGAAPNVLTLRDSVPDGLNASLTRALARSPADRYSSAAAFAADLIPDKSQASPRWNHPIAAAVLFGIAALGTLGAVYFVMLQFGLPYWVLRGAVGLLVIGLPIIVATAFVERQRLAPNDRSRAKHRWLNWRRSLQGGGLAFTGLVVVTVAFMGLRALGIGPLGTLMTKGVLEARDQILLADFENRTSDSTLGATVTMGLRIDLSQSRMVRLVEDGTVIQALARMLVKQGTPLDDELARQVAEREGIKAVLVGEVSSVSSGYMLSARLIAPTDGTLLAAERVTAADETELIRAIDRLSGRLRVRIGESLKDVRASPPLEQVTTTSLAALRMYTEAMTPGAGNALRLVQEAVVLDTNFAMAYRRLGTQLGSNTEAGQAAQRRAFALRDRLPEVERYIVSGSYYATVEVDDERSEAAYRSALALDPDNYIALINLGNLVGYSRLWAVRESLALRSVDVNPIYVGWLNVMNAQLLQGKFAAAQETIDKVVLQGNITAQNNLLFKLEVSRRDYDRAEGVLLQEPQFNFWYVDLMRLRGRLRVAERSLRDMTQEAGIGPGALFDATYRLASIEADYGSVNNGISLLESIPIDSAPPLERHHLDRAEFYARVGRVDSAKRLVVEYEQRLPEGWRRHRDNQAAFLQVSGEIALREGRFNDATADFTAVNDLSWQCTTCGLARLAYSWLEAGQSDSALAVYERLVSAYMIDLYEDDVRWLPQVYKNLGELYEARGDTNKAVRWYSAFVELWKNADPELQPNVNDVRRRIANLTREPRQ